MVDDEGGGDQSGKDTGGASLRFVRDPIYGTVPEAESRLLRPGRGDREVRFVDISDPEVLDFNLRRMQQASGRDWYDEMYRGHWPELDEIGDKSGEGEK